MVESKFNKKNAFFLRTSKCFRRENKCIPADILTVLCVLRPIKSIHVQFSFADDKPPASSASVCPNASRMTDLTSSCLKTAIDLILGREIMLKSQNKLALATTNCCLRRRRRRIKDFPGDDLLVNAAASSINCKQ